MRTGESGAGRLSVPIMGTATAGGYKSFMQIQFTVQNEINSFEQLDQQTATKFPKARHERVGWVLTVGGSGQDR